MTNEELDRLTFEIFADEGIQRLLKDTEDLLEFFKKEGGNGSQ